MSANTALMQSNVADALQRALEDTANEKGGKWGANGEAAATSGVIQFLQKYMRDDAKIIEKVKSGGKMKGAAAQLALTALEFANKCGGVELSFGGRVAAADDKMQEEDAAPAAATGTPNGTRLRAHSAAINTLVGGKKLYGKLKYLQVYKSRYYEIEYNKITQGVAAAASTPFIAMVQSGAAANRQKLQQETIVSNKKIKDYKGDIKKAEKNLIKANDGSFSTIKYEGSTLAYVSYEDSVMIDESGREFVPPLQDGVVDDAANSDAVGLGTPEPKKQRTEWLPLVEVRASRIHGLGLFAKHKILIDTKIGLYDGPEVAYGETMDEASKRAMYSQSPCLLAVKRHGGWCVVDGETEMKFINDPRGTDYVANAVFENDGSVVAIASIQLDEEILVDYGDSYSWTRR